MPRHGGPMGGPGMGGHHRGGPGGHGGFGGHHHGGGFGGHGGPPPPPPRRGYGGGMFGRYRRYRGPYGNPGCLGGCLTFLLGSFGIIALIVLALCAIF